MKHPATVVCSLLLSLATSAAAQDSQPAERTRELAAETVLSDEEQEQLQALLTADAKDSNDEFDRMLKAVISEDPRCVLVVTYLMFELPWVAELEPRHMGDLRMRKARVEQVLDRLVAGSEHDGLSADYFNAVVFPEDQEEGATVEQAQDALIRWTLDRLERFEWSEGAFHVTGEGGG